MYRPSGALIAHASADEVICEQPLQILLCAVFLVYGMVNGSVVIPLLAYLPTRHHNP
jgi:hypothetical protein